MTAAPPDFAFSEIDRIAGSSRVGAIAPDFLTFVRYRPDRTHPFITALATFAGLA
jgi:hypothetical protein